MSTLLSILIQCCLLTDACSALQNPPRKLYIFGQQQHSLLRQQQVTLLYKDKIGLADRDILLIPVMKESALWKEFNVSPNAFAVILIGKDGGEKYRSNQLLQSFTLYGLIDAMPMRKNEIKLRKKSR